MYAFHSIPCLVHNILLPPCFPEYLPIHLNTLNFLFFLSTFHIQSTTALHFTLNLPLILLISLFPSLGVTMKLRFSPVPSSQYPLTASHSLMLDPRSSSYRMSARASPFIILYMSANCFVYTGCQEPASIPFFFLLWFFERFPFVSSRCVGIIV